MIDSVGTMTKSEEMNNFGAQFVLNADGTPLLDHRRNPIPIAKMLSTKPLRSELATRPGPGNKKLTYLSGDSVTRTLNDIFGFDGWCLSVIETKREDCTKDDKGRYHVTYTAQVRVTHRLSGAFKEDCGAADSIDKSMGTATSHALKSSITDAMKRTVRHFGEKLGNSLYCTTFNFNKAPSTLKQALEMYEIERANSKFGFEKNETNKKTNPLDLAKKEAVANDKHMRQIEKEFQSIVTPSSKKVPDTSATTTDARARFNEQSNSCNFVAKESAIHHHKATPSRIPPIRPEGYCHYSDPSLQQTHIQNHIVKKETFISGQRTRNTEQQIKAVLVPSSSINVANAKVPDTSTIIMDARERSNEQSSSCLLATKESAIHHHQVTPSTIPPIPPIRPEGYCRYSDPPLPQTHIQNNYVKNETFINGQRMRQTEQQIKAVVAPISSANLHNASAKHKFQSDMTIGIRATCDENNSFATVKEATIHHHQVTPSMVPPIRPEGYCNYPDPPLLQPHSFSSYKKKQRQELSNKSLDFNMTVKHDLLPLTRNEVTPSESVHSPFSDITKNQSNINFLNSNSPRISRGRMSNDMPLPNQDYTALTNATHKRRLATNNIVQGPVKKITTNPYQK